MRPPGPRAAGDSRSLKSVPSPPLLPLEGFFFVFFGFTGLSDLSMGSRFDRGLLVVRLVVVVLLKISISLRLTLISQG